MPGRLNEAINTQLATGFIERNDVYNRWGNVVSSFLEIPGLVGLWPMSSVQRSTGNAYDVSGQGRTLTYNGNPVYDYENFTPYIDMDGTGDYLSRADETDLDILGTETIYASDKRGLTLGGWYYVDSFTAGPTAIGKFLITGNQRSYLIEFGAGADVFFFVSSNGTATTFVQSTATFQTGEWIFVVGRFDPSTELKIFYGSPTVEYTSDINTTSIPASVFNSTAQLNLGAFNNGASALMNGRISINFLSANYLSDSIIKGLFEQSRVLYGV